ncbi:MAG: purine-nucleoside phosphorylase [Bacteroidales bacterium]|nr:purine-nucleoside phosphorylase [Bacteroidales bacterium]
MNNEQYLQQVKESATWIRNKIGGEVTTAIILGSGLGDLAYDIDPICDIPYQEIPNFPKSTAPGHHGHLIYGTLGKKPVLAMQGRFHFYEGYEMCQVVFPVRVFKYLGITHLIVSNAAGGINTDYRIGDLMIIKDHINLMPNPLLGKNIEELGERFTDMTRAYDRSMIQMADKIAQQLNIPLQHGVYVGSTGPTFETPAEYNYFRTIGGDACGMSTVPEVIAARHCGINVFGMSVITNEGFNFADDFKNDGQDVIVVAKEAGKKMIRIVKAMIETM